MGLIVFLALPSLTGLALWLMGRRRAGALAWPALGAGLLMGAAAYRVRGPASSLFDDGPQVLAAFLLFGAGMGALGLTLSGLVHPWAGLVAALVLPLIILFW